LFHISNYDKTVPDKREIKNKNDSRILTGINEKLYNIKGELCNIVRFKCEYVERVINAGFLKAIMWMQICNAII